MLAPVPRYGDDPPLIPAALASDMVVEVDDALMLRGLRRPPCAVDEDEDGGPMCMDVGGDIGPVMASGSTPAARLAANWSEPILGLRGMAQSVLVLTTVVNLGGDR